MEGQMEQTNMGGEQPKGGSSSLLIAVIVIIVTGIIAYLVYSGAFSSGPEMMNETQDMMMNETSDPFAENLEMQASSDDLGSIEADLNATDFENLDQI